MKKTTTILIVLLCFFSQKAISQIHQKDTTKNPWIIKAGLTLVPQGSMSLENPDKFNAFWNLFGGVTLIKGDFFNTTFYSMAFNQIGTAVGYNFNPDLLMYAVGCKTTIANTDYVGIGMGTPLANGQATGFIEVGSGTKDFKPSLYIGMFIPFTRQIK